MKLSKRGILIACEGIDGSGKSTFAQALYHYFSHHNIPALLTKEPGGTVFGTQLRTHLQNPAFKRCPKAEFLLFAADRAQHFHEVIIPELAKGTIIISDRLSDSSLVYQGYGRGLDRSLITTVNAWAMNDHKPDLTLYLRIDAQTAFDRICKRNEEATAFEQENKDFFTTLIAGFDALYAHRTDVITLDGNNHPNNILNDALIQLTAHGALQPMSGTP